MSRNRMPAGSDELMKDEEELEVQDEEDEYKDDEVLGSHKKNKRSSDTCLEDALSPTSYREPKRAKLDPFPALKLRGIGSSTENQDLALQSNRNLAKSFIRAATESACQKFTFPSVIINATPSSIFSLRARSVPLPTEPLPELDLRLLSPKRSPSKITSPLKITIISKPIEPAPTSPLTPCTSNYAALTSENEMDVVVDPDLPNLTNPTIDIEFATPQGKALCTLQGPSSPLTPLTPTSFGGRPPVVQSLLAASTQKSANQSEDAVVRTAASLLAVNAAESSTSFAPSRLPRPSTSTSPLTPPSPLLTKRGRSATIAGSHTARSKPVPNLSKGKKVMPPPPGPRRLTRSVSMKEKKPEGLDESNKLSKATSQPNAGASTSKEIKTSSQATTSKVPTLEKSSSKGRIDSVKLKQQSLASFMKAKPAPSLSTTNSSSSTSTLPPKSCPSLSQIPLPLSPDKQRAGTSAMKATFTHHSTFGSSKHTSSLSTLSTALEKLAMPPPSRPNTSLGFNINLGKDEDTRASLSMTKDDNDVTRSSGTFSRPTASSLKRHATIVASTRVNVMGKMKDRSGQLGRTATGIFGRGLAGPSMKASKKTSLPSVMASPVKGGACDDSPTAVADLGGRAEYIMQERQSVVAAPAVPPDSRASEAEGQSEEASFVIEELTSSIDKGKKPEGWDSHRASSALHALSQSLSVLPQTPPKLVAVGTRTGLRSSSSTYHAASGSDSKVVADMKGKGKIQDSIESAAPPQSIPSKSDPSKSDTAGSPVEGGSAGKKSALKVLKKCTIFVDVRTDDGDDAGSLFVDMLRSLGARILGRVGQSCTHIVYKNGSASTLTRYRLLNDPKPVVVGIAWVVECVEQRSRIDEAKFKVDLELVNVAGTSKRRRSMLPKHMSPVASAAGPCYIPINLSSDDNGNRQLTGGDGSPAQDTDTSFRSTKDDDDLPPLERARRRRSILPGGQTRLV